MATLPWGFSPVNAAKQAGDWAGVYGDNRQGSNYDTFSELGNNQTRNGISGSPNALSLIGNIGTANATSDITGGFANGGLQYDSQNATPTRDGSGSGSGGGSSPSYSAQDLQYLDQNKSLFERLLGDVDTYQRQAREKLDANYTNAKKGAERDYGRTTGQYDQQEYDVETNKQREVNRVDTNSRTLNDSLRKILGMASGSGSSAFQFAAPSAVARAASGERSNVMDSYSRNMGDLENARKESEEDYTSLLDELLGNYQNQQFAQEAGFAKERQNINRSLEEVAAERASLLGGNPLSAAAPYRTASAALQDQLVGMGDNYKTNIDTREVKARPVTLRDYIADRQAINANNQFGSADNSPYAQFLAKQREEERTI